MSTVQLTTEAQLAIDAYCNLPQGLGATATLYAELPQDMNRHVAEMLRHLRNGVATSKIAKATWQSLDAEQPTFGWETLTQREQESCARETQYVVEQLQKRMLVMNTSVVEPLADQLLAPRRAAA